MYTLTAIIFLIAVIQAFLHIFKDDDEVTWMQHGVAYSASAAVAGIIAWAIWSDLYPEVPVDLLKKGSFPKEFNLILALSYWGLSSFYRICMSRHTQPPKTHEGRASLLTAVIKPVASILSFIASVLGIVSFYLQFLRSSK
jgi:hypothetical protein